MFNNFIVKSLLKKQLKGLPEDVQEKILTGMKEIDPLLTKAENFIEKFEKYKDSKLKGSDYDDTD